MANQAGPCTSHLPPTTTYPQRKEHSLTSYYCVKMPLYILTSKPGWKRKKHTRAPAWKPRSQPHDKVSPQPFYQVESPQEFDERDNELGPDAQVWKTYVKETEQIDGEQVDAWNK
ncbi:hypothetical protein AG1IA_07968 [Rhizoctonia solani AG-1 IA]|uniref:Uncharacterized protein n=1 Tax=Thanatephorus cucumeris (strain AG1-IA) TaxID=983506 RepID=L8WJ93_THACA|nr:hypothetical protein AG1IA_07968 [Rhizoctonia solani AG-1 IA]